MTCRPAILLGLMLVFLSFSANSAERQMSAAERGVSAWLETYRNQMPLVRAFVQQLPKGADLHTHLSGTIYAERYIEWAAQANYYLDPRTSTLVPGYKSGFQAVSDVIKNPADYSDLINHLSTRDLAFAGRSGHDQFFAVFGEFGSVSSSRVSDMVADVANRAARQNIFYLELMASIHSQSMQAAGVPPDIDFDKAQAWLEQAGLESWISQGESKLQKLIDDYSKILGCNTDKPQPGCDVTIRFQQESVRVLEPAILFKQFAYAFGLANRSSQVVGINLVAPEDNRIALRDYDLQMQMVSYFGSRYPDVNIALHAGELTLGQVPPARLHDHITKAVDIAGARRIGHGVDIFYEQQPFALLDRMRDSDVAVEICLTSNDVILGVKGRDHPFPAYLQSGVPVVLSSDDAGVSRIDLSNEYLRAVRDYGLGYSDLKRLSRHSLEHSFLPGQSLWKNNRYDVMAGSCRISRSGVFNATCRRYISDNKRAELQLQLEQAFVEFELDYSRCTSRYSRDPQPVCSFPQGR